MCFFSTCCTQNDVIVVVTSGTLRQASAAMPVLALVNATLSDSTQLLTPIQQIYWIWFFLITATVIVCDVCICMSNMHVSPPNNPLDCDDVEEKVVLFPHLYDAIDTKVDDVHTDPEIIIQFAKSRPISIPQRAARQTYQDYLGRSKDRESIFV